ncbi:MAG: YceI family protein [Candidatus Omnitrophota bacterium]|nr:YceI family protein [Candidatus Omnitrophota bacterium]
MGHTVRFNSGARLAVAWWILVAVTLHSPPCGWTQTYTIDRHHSTVSFEIRHFFARLEGAFRGFEGTIEHVPGESAQWAVDATIRVASIHTKHPPRDEHLLSGEFFDEETFPAITFKSSGVEDAGEGNYRLKGLLTMHGVEKPVKLDMKYLGTDQDPWGNDRARFTATGVLKRSDFGIDWNVAWKNGAWLLSEEVVVKLDIQALPVIEVQG